MANRADLTGKVVGRLTFLEFSHMKGSSYWKVKCSCGNTKTVNSSNVLCGDTQSCGCLNIETVVKRLTTHGMCRTPEYDAWSKMVTRCTNKKIWNYKNYGGRGISVCNEWLNSFEEFIKDMGVRPTPGHSIDRIDNNGNYEPGNCRWATRFEQATNRRTNRRLRCNGETTCLCDLVKTYGVPKSTIQNRINRGWSVEDAVTLPPHTKRS